MCELGWKQLNMDKITPRAETNKKGIFAER
jgi:hypothetical protein